MLECDACTIRRRMIELESELHQSQAREEEIAAKVATARFWLVGNDPAKYQHGKTITNCRSYEQEAVKLLDQVLQALAAGGGGGREC